MYVSPVIFTTFISNCQKWPRYYGCQFFPVILQQLLLKEQWKELSWVNSHRAKCEQNILRLCLAHVSVEVGRVHTPTTTFLGEYNCTGTL